MLLRPVSFAQNALFVSENLKILLTGLSVCGRIIVYKKYFHE